MATPVSGYSSSANTAHGTVYYYQGSAAASAIMASMVRVEAAKASSSQEQAVRALRAANLPAEQAALIEPITLSIIGAIIAGASLAASTVSAAAAATSAATGLGAMVQQANASGLQSLEVEVENLSLTPVVLGSYQTNDGSSSSVLKPLAPGESDTMIVVNSSDGFGEGDASVVLHFLTGGGVNGNEQPLTPIQATCTVAYDDNGNWAPKLSIDGSSSYSDTSDGCNAVALFFTSPDDTIMDFTIASVMTEKSTSGVYFMFLPGSSTYTG